MKRKECKAWNRLAREGAGGKWVRKPRLKRFDHHNTLNYVQPTDCLLKLSPYFWCFSFSSRINACGPEGESGRFYWLNQIECSHLSVVQRRAAFERDQMKLSWGFLWVFIFEIEMCGKMMFVRFGRRLSKMLNKSMLLESIGFICFLVSFRFVLFCRWHLPFLSPASSYSSS